MSGNKISSIDFIYEAFGNDKEKIKKYIKDENIIDVEINGQYYKSDTFLTHYDKLIEEYLQSIA